MQDLHPPIWPLQCKRQCEQSKLPYGKYHKAKKQRLWWKRQLEKEKELIAAQARNEGKPDQIVEKIVDGRIGSFYKDNVLLDQVFVRSDKFEGTVGDMVQQLAARMGENISISSMARVAVGEG